MTFAKTALVSFALMSVSPVLANDFATDNEGATKLSQPAGYERVAEVLIAEKLCRVFGYSVDAVALANWANSQTEALAEQSGDELSEAHQRMTRSIRAHFWLVRHRYQFAFARPDERSFYNVRRFQLRYRDKCEELAGSGDAGRFFVKTSEEAPYDEMIEDVRVNFMRLDIPRARQAGKRRPLDVRIPQ